MRNRRQATRTRSLTECIGQPKLKGEVETDDSTVGRRTPHRQSSRWNMDFRDRCDPLRKWNLKWELAGPSLPTPLAGLGPRLPVLRVQPTSE